MHRKLFSIMGIFHSLFCRGDKNYKQSLGNIKSFNLSKQLTVLFSLPNKYGHRKLNYCNFDLISNVLKDLHLFNFCLANVNDIKKGERKAQILAAPYDNLDRAKFNYLKQQPRDSTDFLNYISVNLVAMAFTDV